MSTGLSEYGSYSSITVEVTQHLRGVSKEDKLSERNIGCLYDSLIIRDDNTYPHWLEDHWRDKIVPVVH